MPQTLDRVKQEGVLAFQQSGTIIVPPHQNRCGGCQLPAPLVMVTNADIAKMNKEFGICAIDLLNVV